MSLESLPDTLRATVEHDLRPVRPLPPVWMRTLVAVSSLAVVLAFAFARAGLRSDLDQLPMWLSWGCSMLQLALGVLLIGLAMREAVPGQGAPWGVIQAAAGTALAVQVLIGVATAIYSPIIDLADGISSGIGCFKHESAIALPVFAVILWLVFRAFPLRAPVAGLLGGAGATVAGDAVIHLLCPVTSLAHVLIWHTGAVLVFMALGWLIGLAWQLVRWRERA